MLKGKHVLLAVSGSIAAYKSALLVRLLVKQGAEVRVVMTRSAMDFITPLTLSVLSKNEVLSDLSDTKAGVWHNHVDLALWADLLLVAPASANTIAKMAHGLCDNLLLAVYLSARCPVYLAPAMDLEMYRHPGTTENLEKLQSRGHHLLPSGTGELASGLIGQGRMTEPEEIVALLEQALLKEAPLRGRKAMVTAGPTFEAIDPVRFIGNHSSGKMGFALAEELARNGAEVELVCGPNALHLSNPKILRRDVTSAQQMYDLCMDGFKTSDIAVLSAAVADFRPVRPALSKIKKQQDEMPRIELEKTPDILAELGKRKSDKQLLVGFALETDAELEHAKHKLISKNLDFIVLNSLNDHGAGFGTDTNKITIIDKYNKIQNFELKDKAAVAIDIVNRIKELVV